MTHPVFRLVLPSAPWLGCLSELRACYSVALRKAGYAVTLADTYLAAGEAGEDYQLAFGAHAVAPPDPFWGIVLMQSEHHAHHFTLDYLRQMERAHLVVNMGPFDLRLEDGYKLCGKGLVECPPGVMPEDEVEARSPIPDLTRDIDVLHYGSITPRRAAILESLAKAGIKVTSLYGVLGAARDLYIDRAKIVLDLKQDGTEPPDVTRVFWSLSRGVCTLSENAPDDSPAKITPETVVETVQGYLDAPPEHRALCRDMYARQIGPCDVSPLLRALGLAEADDLPPEWHRFNDDDRQLDALASIGMDCADVKVIDGRVTLWCGATDEGLQKVRDAIPWVQWEMVNGRAAVVP